MPYTPSVGNVSMDQLGGMEWVILLIILAIIFFFGPKKIPELMRGLGRGMGEFKRGQQEIEREIKREFAEAATDDERKDHEKRVLSAARELGVEVEGRGQREIKLDMAKRLESAPSDRVVAAAKALAISVDGVEIQRVREGLVRKLGV